MSAPPPSTAPRLDSRWQLFALLALIALFQLLTIRSGHAWGDDFALYILHARSLLEGRAYGDTGFIYHPVNPFFSPRVYPPGFPLLLLPVYAAFGLNLMAMKVLVVLLFLGALAAFAVLVRPTLPMPYVLAAVAILGFQPYLTELKNHVLPDLPFLLFVMLSLLLLRHLDRQVAAGWRGVLVGVLAGAVTYYAVALRTVGIALYGGLALTLLFRRRLPNRAVIACVLTGLALWAAQRSLLPPDSGYVSQIGDAAGAAGAAAGSGSSGGSVLDLLPDLARVGELTRVVYLVLVGIPSYISLGIMVILLLLAAGGLAIKLRSFSTVEGFVFSYAAVIFLYPAYGNRYVVPLLPFMLYYALISVSLLNRRLGRPAVVGAIFLGLGLAGTYTRRLAWADYGPEVDGADSPAALQLYAGVRACTRPEDRILFYKARAMTLYTRRPGLATPGRRVDLPLFLTDNDIPYVAVRKNDRVDSLAWNPAHRLRPIYSNSIFTLYRNDALPAASNVTSPQCASAASGS